MPPREGGRYSEVVTGPLLVALLLLGTPSPGGPGTAGVEFEPKVGVTGTEVRVAGPLPPGAAVKFGARVVPALRESDGSLTFRVPEGSVSAFIEVTVSGKPFGKSAVPFVVAGSSLVNAPKLIGLKEAIDVFGYVDPVPEGGEAPEERTKAVLKLGDSDILSIGPVAPMPGFLGPAVSLGDAASAARTGMGPPGLILTARPPKKKLTVPTPPPQ